MKQRTVLVIIGGLVLLRLLFFLALIAGATFAIWVAVARLAQAGQDTYVQPVQSVTYTIRYETFLLPEIIQRACASPVRVLGCQTKVDNVYVIRYLLPTSWCDVQLLSTLGHETMHVFGFNHGKEYVGVGIPLATKLEEVNEGCEFID